MKRSGTLAALLGMCVVLTILLLLFLPVFRVTDITVTGNDLVSEDEIIAVARQNSSNILPITAARRKKHLKKTIIYKRYR